MVEDPKIVATEFWKRVFTEGKLDLIDELLSPDFVLHDLATKENFSREKLKDRLSSTLNAIPYVEAIVEDQVMAEGDQVVTRVTLRAPRPQPSAPSSMTTPGTGQFEVTLKGHSGDHAIRLLISPTGGASGATGDSLPASSSDAALNSAPTPYAPSDQWVDISGIAVSRMSGGKIGETWFLWEEMRASQELRPDDIQWRWPPWR